MKIGVAVPAYIGHIVPLFNLLDSIQNQTLLPDKVVVSCSSTKTSDLDLYLDKLKTYSFILQIITSEEKKNAAQNRNIAASNLSDVDYLTFMDADDTMHPQRIEILLNAFMENDCDIILHNYLNFDCYENISIKKIENNDIIIRNNSLKQDCYYGLKHKDDNNINDKIHHSQVSVKRIIFDIIHFPEEFEYIAKEDSVYCHRVFSIPNIKDSYISNELSYYKASYSQ
jgi:hypothetical protein